MQAPWKLICVVLALVLFFIGAVSSFVPYAASPNPPGWRSYGLVCAGLFFYMLSIIVS
jgi:hypothetical protein